MPKAGDLEFELRQFMQRGHTRFDGFIVDAGAQPGHVTGSVGDEEHAALPSSPTAAKIASVLPAGPVSISVTPSSALIKKTFTTPSDNSYSFGAIWFMRRSFHLRREIARA